MVCPDGEQNDPVRRETPGGPQSGRTNAMIAMGDLAGTWRLVSAIAVDAEGRRMRPPYGPVPMGRLILSETGRMMAVICDGRISIPESGRRGYSSYCGNYRIEDGCLITRVDAAAIEARIGGEEVRKVEFRGRRLVLTPPPRPDGEQRELEWELEGPA